jgi:hypothetical protein
MDKLEQKYYSLCNSHSDINEHLPTLYEYAKDCESIIELGVRGVTSTYSFVRGLINNNSKNKSLLINDIESCPIDELVEIITELPIEFNYNWVNDLDMVVEKNYDMTFIDTYHVYGLLKRELNKYSKITNKYIIMHDTEIDGINGELYRCGYKSESELYNNAITMSNKIGIPTDEILKGLLPAIYEFLNNNTNWVIDNIYTNNNGLTVLRRID